MIDGSDMAPAPDAAILHGDCLEVMRHLIADGVRVDAIVTDPPYHFGSVDQTRPVSAARADGGREQGAGMIGPAAE